MRNISGAISGLIYLASPYSHPQKQVRQRRFDAACQATAAMMRAGLIVFPPIAHSHPLTRFDLPGYWQFWERYDRVHIEGYTGLAVLMLDGWKQSKGVQSEISIAHQLGRPVIFIVPEELDVTESAPVTGTRAQKEGLT